MSNYYKLVKMNGLKAKNIHIAYFNCETNVIILQING